MNRARRCLTSVIKPTPMRQRRIPYQRDRERTIVGVLGLTTSIPSSTATSSETEKGEETDSLLIKAAMEPVSDEYRGFYSNLFLVKKQDGGFRSVINLRGLNSYAKKRSFMMATLKYVSQSIRNWETGRLQCEGLFTDERGGRTSKVRAQSLLLQAVPGQETGRQR